jgi:hypothetical protein
MSCSCCSFCDSECVAGSCTSCACAMLHCSMRRVKVRNTCALCVTLMQYLPSSLRAGTRTRLAHGSYSRSNVLQNASAAVQKCDVSFEISVLDTSSVPSACTACIARDCSCSIYHHMSILSIVHGNILLCWRCVCVCVYWCTCSVMSRNCGSSCASDCSTVSSDCVKNSLLVRLLCHQYTAQCANTPASVGRHIRWQWLIQSRSRGMLMQWRMLVKQERHVGGEQYVQCIGGETIQKLAVTCPIRWPK